MHRGNADLYAKEIQFRTEYRQHKNLLLEGMHHFVLQNKIYIRTDGDAIVRSAAWVNVAVAVYQIHIQRLRTEGVYEVRKVIKSHTHAKTCAAF